MVIDLLVIRAVAGSSGDAARAAERKTDVKDRVADDLDFAGNAGKGVFGAQTAHQGNLVENGCAQATRGRATDVAT
jgi:hypothetical protein